MGRIFKLGVVLADGTRRRFGLLDGRVRIVRADGTVVALANGPTDVSPLDGGQARVVRANGTVALLAYEEDWYSMQLTTLARLKAHLGGIATSGQDAILTSTIDDVSVRVERYLRRQILRQTNVETVPLRRWATTISLDAYPVTSITSIKYAAHPSDFSSVNVLDARLYVLEDAVAGLVRFLISTSVATHRLPGYVQMTYVGGMATDTADFMLTWPDLARAVDLQCAYEYQRRNTPGGNVTSDAGGTAFIGELDWLVSVRATLDMYRRHVIS